MVNYPQTYTAKASAAPGIKGSWKSFSKENVFDCAIPPVYEGSGGAFSPEELFLLSLQNCLIASFKVYAEHAGLSFDHFNVSSKLTVNIHEGLGPVMESVEMSVKIEDASDVGMAKELLDRAARDGFIFNSIKTAVSIKLDF